MPGTPAASTPTLTTGVVAGYLERWAANRDYTTPSGTTNTTASTPTNSAPAASTPTVSGG